MILAGGQAYTIQGNYAVPAHSDVSTVLPLQASAAGPAPPPSLNQTLTPSHFAAAHPSSPFASHGHHPLLPGHLTAGPPPHHHHHHHHPLHPSSLHASVAGLADPLLKSGHLQAALPPALLADAVSLLFFVIQPPTPHLPPNPLTPSVTSYRFVTVLSYRPFFTCILNDVCPPPLLIFINLNF